MDFNKTTGRRRKLIVFICFLLINFNLYAQSPLELNAKGKDLLKKGDYKEAIKLFTKAIESDEHNAETFFNRAKAFNGSKEYQHAYDDYSKAIHINNDYAEAYMERGMLMASFLKDVDAINDLDMAVKYATSDSLRYASILARSGSKLHVRNYDGAFEDSKTFYDHDTTSKDALITMALAKIFTDGKAEAAGYVKKVLSRLPNDTVALLDMGFVYLKMEQYDSALYYYEKALTIDKNNAICYSNLSFVKLKKGDVRGALKDVNYSLKLLPNNSYAYYYRAQIYLEMVDTEKACEDLHTAVQRGFTDRYGNDVQDLIDKNCSEKKRR